MVRVQKQIVVDDNLIVVQASGRLDVDSTKKAIDGLVVDSGLDGLYHVLIDLRQVECDLLASEIRDIAAYVAQPEPALPADRKVAVVVGRQRHFDQADLFTLFAQHRGLSIKAFDNAEEAERWLDSC